MRRILVSRLHRLELQASQQQSLLCYHLVLSQAKTAPSVSMVFRLETDILQAFLSEGKDADLPREPSTDCGHEAHLPKPLRP